MWPTSTLVLAQGPLDNEMTSPLVSLNFMDQSELCNFFSSVAGICAKTLSSPLLVHLCSVVFSKSGVLPCTSSTLRNPFSSISTFSCPCSRILQKSPVSSLIETETSTPEYFRQLPQVPGPVPSKGQHYIISSFLHLRMISQQATFFKSVLQAYQFDLAIVMWPRVYGFKVFIITYKQLLIHVYSLHLYKICKN